jgi:hypothetical protein
MAAAYSSSALVVDQGRRVLLRIQGRVYELSDSELRKLLALPAGNPGLGITVDRDRFCFEFAVDNLTIQLSAEQLHRRMARQKRRVRAG